MNKIDWKKVLPHVIAIGIFLVVAFIYCKPALQGKVLQQSDITQWKAMSKDIYDYKEKFGHAPLWTNSMFSGMPGYLIAGETNNDVPYYWSELLSLFLGKPFQFFFLACVCFYFLTQVLRVKSWIGIIGALAYAYATYNVVIVSVGHDTKMLSIALLPGLVGSLILTYERQYLWGAAFTALFAGALISQNHYQIAYYGMIVCFAMTIGYIVGWVKAGEFKHLVIASVVTLLSGLTGVFSNAVVILPNYEYTNQTIRGGSALADGNSNVGKEGLSKSYAFSYSMNIAEPLVLMAPHIYGGSINPAELPTEDSKAVEALQEMNPQVAQQLQGAIAAYWGEAHTSGPPYAGVVICFLAIVGFVVLDGKHKWWILATIALTVMMSWGGFFESFNNFLFRYLPMYNKFRAPGMIIIVPTLLVGMMAVMSLQKILFGFDDKKLLMAQLKKGLMVTGGVFVVLLLAYFGLGYRGAGDTAMMQQIQQIPDAATKSTFETAASSLINGLVEDRKRIFFGDILKALFYVAICGGAIWLYAKNTFKAGVALAVIGVLSFIDIMSVNVKYLNADNYLEKEENDASFVPTAADLAIMKDTSTYRVFNVVGDNVPVAFNHGALPSYFHNSIGGYHPAKLSIYQDLIEKQLYNFPRSMNVVNMLNTKYIIYGDPKNPQIQQNPDALGPVWFVKNVQFVQTPQQEMSALDNLNTRDTAVAQQAFANILKGAGNADSTANIKLINNNHDVVTYQSNTATPQVAVFSEVYYDKGWNAYLDGNKVPFAKVNYVLRGMTVAAGQHTIVFKFEPASYYLGRTITTICSVLTILLLLGAIGTEIKNTNKKIIASRKPMATA